MTTPVRQQYLRLKAEYPEALLLFRLGDFYEMFDADAEVGARELGLTLTSRQFARGERSPMAGVPCHHADTHIARLVARGYNVAIAEQIGEAGSGKGLVERKIARVITPGTVREPGLLESGSNNFLAAVLVQGGAAGIAYVDVSTGEFYIQHLVAEPVQPALLRELGRIAPAECLWPHEGLQFTLRTQPELAVSADQPGSDGTAGETRGGAVAKMVPEHWRPQPSPAGALPMPDRIDLAPPFEVPGCVMTPVAAHHFSADAARVALQRRLGLGDLRGKPYAQYILGLAAAAALLAYLDHTQPSSLPILREPRLYHAEEHMTLDAPTRRNLELTQTMRGGALAGSLLAVLDRTKTAMGGRLLRRWLSAPLVVLPPLLRRQESVAALAASTARRLTVVESLSGIGDIDRLVCRAQQGSASPRELVALARTLERVVALRSHLAEWSGMDAEPLSPSGSSIASLHAALDPCADVAAEIRRAFVDEPPPATTDGGFVRPGYAADIDAVDAGSKDAREWLAGIEAAERARTGIKTLRVVYSRVFGYAIEVGKSGLAAVPEEYVRKQTVAGGERYVTPDLKQREAQLLKAQEQRLRLEMQVLEELRRQVAEAANRMLRSADAVGQLDVYAAFATAALERDYHRPELDEGDLIQIKGGRHPVVEVSRQDIAFVPNDTLLDERCRLAVLTGPNMAGKSTYLRQVALIVLLAQVGSFVPAETARVGLVDRIFTRVGAQDDLAAGQSTFMVEMSETSAILAECTPRSLLILDEIGRGTSTHDGLALAQAVLEYLHDDGGHRAKTIFATHFHELTALAERRAHIRNFRMDVLEEGEQVVFLRRVVPGAADKAYGIHVAQLSGLPLSVVLRARALLREYESGAGAIRGGRRVVREQDAAVQLPLFGE